MGQPVLCAYLKSHTSRSISVTLYARMSKLIKGID